MAIAVSEYYDDPLGFVRFAYQWGKPGPLRDYPGPDKWQVEFLTELGEQVRQRKFDGTAPVLPIRFSTASGHGIGKSVLVAFLVDWIMSTRPHAKGTITANTFQQLSTRTWATVQTWTKRCITAHWFTVTGDKMYHSSFKDSWFCSAQSCREENSEAFAGQHAANSTSFYIFDEASAVPDKIHEVAEGGLTDGEPMFFMFGNATRSQGTFHRVTFGSERRRWVSRSIDSRDCRFSNKELIEQWREDHGEDSDFFRVRVLGLPPRADDSQFIDMDRISGAQKRQVHVLEDEPLIAGVDLAWGGDDENVVRFRCGNDGRSIKPLRIPGERTRDSAVMVVKLAEMLDGTYEGRKIHTMFIDSAGISGAVGSRLRQLGHRNIIEVNFGADSPDSHYAYMRDYMWGKMKEWLLAGAIDNHPGLEVDLSGPGYSLDKRVRVKLESKEEMKKRGLDSPDDGDALALTFAQ
ncbi:MAG TPA: hypothetical protein VFC46_04375, partial [Humisphaera sp.]|nr:hypothetical protein [Humisphaera sp.]